MFFERFQKDDCDALTTTLARKFAAKAGPYSEKLEKAISEGDTASLVNFHIDYTCGIDPVHVFAARQCAALYSKRDDIDIGVDKERVALDKFIESELACYNANQRIIKSRTTCIPSRVASVLFMAQRKISKILGDLPGLHELQLAFGPGANTNVRKTTSARWKLSAPPACSTNMLGIISDVLAEIPAYTDLHKWSETEESWTTRVSVEAGKLMFVPKNAKTMRSIIVEPSMNSLVQKGYGTYMKRRLLYAGVNLYDQTLNQSRAKQGSIDGSLMTIDLSSASDTICRELVAELLPLDWYLALKRATTTEVTYKGELFSDRLEKFSSMGNGFTFELESLIFSALTESVCRVLGIKPDVSVYGDDIICPPDAYELLNEVFCFCGFSVNNEKSYRQGPFRESCGADFLTGVNVRPYYQKTSWSFGAMTAFHNFLVDSGWGWVFPDVVEHLVDGIPDPFRNYGPAGYGDGHLVSYDLTLKPYGRDRGWSGYVFTTFVKKTKRIKRFAPGDFILPVYSVYMRMSEEESFNPHVVRGESGEKLISVYTLGRF